MKQPELEYKNKNATAERKWSGTHKNENICASVEDVLHQFDDSVESYARWIKH